MKTPPAKRTMKRQTPVPNKASPSPGATSQLLTRILSGGPRVSPGAISRVGAPTNRRSMVRAMLAMPSARSLLLRAAAAKGFNPSQLETRSLGGGMPGSECVSGSTVLSAARAAPRDNPVDALDWDAGVRFSPAYPGPSYAIDGTTWGTGAIQIVGTYIPLGMDLQEMHERDTVILRPGHNLVYICTELPSGAATYTVQLHVAPADGTSLSAWLGGRPASEFIQFGALHETAYASPGLEPLADNSGFLAVVNLTPDDRGLSGVDRERSGMRQVDCVFDIAIESCVPAGAAFGGITVMRW